jgi:hypothetical protein
LAMVILVWRRRRKNLEIRTADNPPTESSADAMPEGTIRPFLATQSSLSSALSPKTPRPASAPWPGSTSPAVREELRQAVREAVREAIPGSRSDDSWHTVHVDALPPLYSRGEVRV